MGSKPGSYMPNKAVPDLHKMSGVQSLCMCESIFVETSKTGQCVVLPGGTFRG